MIRTANRSDTAALLEELGTLEDSVPRRARRFHELLGELREELGKQSARWSPLVSAGAVAELRQRLGRLQELAGDLTALVRAAEGLGQEIGQLAGRAAERDDLEISRWIKDRSESWSDRLAEVAAGVGSEKELAPDQDRIEEIEDEIRLTFQALYWLGQIEEALELFPDDVPAEHEEARDRLRQELLASGVTEPWLVAVRQSVTGVKEKAEQENRKPRELRTVAELLPALHRWSAELETLADEVRQLDARHKKIVVEDWATLRPRELLSAAQRLMQALTTRAREIRSRRLAELRDAMAELTAACGEQPALLETLAKLEVKELTRPEGHRQWLRDGARLRERMGAIANTHRSDLERRLESRLAELRDTLAELSSDPLPDAVRERARRVDREAAALAEPGTAEEALRRLDRARGLLAEVAELRRQALSEAEAWRAAQDALARDHAELRAAAKRVGLPVRDLGKRLDELHTVDAGTESLEQCQRSAGALGAELAALREEFVDRCRARLAEDLRLAAGLVEVLARIDPDTTPARSLTIADGAGPDAAAQAVLDGAELVETLNAGAAAAAPMLEERRRRAVAELGTLEGEDLGPDEREALGNLLEELEGASSTAPEDLERLVAVLEKVEFFTDRREEEKRRVAARLELLRRRLEAFHDENLKAFCPWLTERVTALVYGLPDPPPPSADVRHQLELADRLFEKLDRQARRLAAHRLDADVRRLARSPAAAALLEELEHQGHRSLPSAVLRLKVGRAIARQAEGHHA